VSDRRDDATHIIGLIADTHGLVRPDVHTALAGVELILHAGDVGGDAILDKLELIAPVRAVCGNTDVGGDPRLASEIDLIIGGVRIHVSHGHEVGAPTPAKLLARYDADVIVYGHTHKQLVMETDGRWVVNPGAAGPRRFDLLPSVARMMIQERRVAIDVRVLRDVY
jgi:putative phosphoesterase